MRTTFMKYSHLIIAGMVVGLALAGCKGPTGSAGLSTGTLRGSAVDTATGKALAGALITGTPSLFSTTTDTNGNFVIQNVPVGIYQVTASFDGYISQTTGFLSIVAGQSVTIPFKLSTVPSPATNTVANAGPDQWSVGYGASVTMNGSASTSASGKPLTYTWTQVPNSASAQMALPPVTILNGTSSSMLQIQLPTLQQFLASLDVPVQVPDRFGVLGISPWMGGGTGNEINLYGFQLTVTDGTDTSTTTVYVSPASTTSGLTNVPIGITQYLDGGTRGGAQHTWNWQVVSAPGGSGVTALVDPTSETPHVTPDIAGQYVFLEAVSGQEITINAGTYVGWSQCAQCHDGNIANAPLTVGPWLGTKHATMFTKMINGDYQDDNAYRERCSVCHTLGNTPEETEPSNGWWDAQVSTGWVFPFVANDYSFAINKDNWFTMPQSLKNMSNIQCENCHGPGNVHTGTLSYDQAVCFQCHDNTDDEDVANEWRTSVHAQSLTAQAAGMFVTESAFCVKCHVSQEFVAVNFKGQITPTTVADPFPVNCAACHDPHSAANPDQLRIYGSNAVAGGTFTLTNAGAGAICTQCHTDQNPDPNALIALALTGGTTPTDATTIYQSTAELFASGRGFTLTGAGPYAPTVLSSPHATDQFFLAGGTNLCVTCHMYNPSYITLTTGNHSFAMSDGFSDDTEACGQCHIVGAPTSAYNNIVTGFDTWVDPYLSEPVPDWDGSPVQPCPQGQVCTSGTEGIQDRVQGLLSVLACAITTSAGQSCVARTADISGASVAWTITMPATRFTADIVSPSNGTAGFAFTGAFTESELDAVYNYNLVAHEGSMGIHDTRFDVELLQRAFNDLAGADIPGATLY